MINLNKVNGADKILLEYAKRLTKLKTKKPLIGVEMGIAYGGGVEAVLGQWEPAHLVALKRTNHETR